MGIQKQLASEEEMLRQDEGCGDTIFYFWIALVIGLALLFPIFYIVATFGWWIR